MATASQGRVADGTPVLASLCHGGIDIGQAEADDVVGRVSHRAASAASILLIGNLARQCGHPVSSGTG
jgi:hypothetical protein